MDDLDFSVEDKKVIERFRKTQLYKFDNVSDFKSIRDCFKVSKQLYECLKYFDSRSSRFPIFNNYNDKMYKKRRSLIYPSEYYSFKFFDVDISIQKDRRKNLFFVGCVGFTPYTFSQEVSIADSDFKRFGSSPVFAEVVNVFFKILAEFLDRKLNFKD